MRISHWILWAVLVLGLLLAYWTFGIDHDPPLQDFTGTGETYDEPVIAPDATGGDELRDEPDDSPIKPLADLREYPEGETE